MTAHVAHTRLSRVSRLVWLMEGMEAMGSSGSLSEFGAESKAHKALARSAVGVAIGHWSMVNGKDDVEKIFPMTNDPLHTAGRHFHRRRPDFGGQAAALPAPILHAAWRITNDEIPMKSDVLLTKSDENRTKMTKQNVITDESVTKFHEGNDEMDTGMTKPITKLEKILECAGQRLAGAPDNKPFAWTMACRIAGRRVSCKSAAAVRVVVAAAGWDRGNAHRFSTPVQPVAYRPRMLMLRLSNGDVRVYGVAWRLEEQE